MTPEVTTKLDLGIPPLFTEEELRNLPAPTREPKVGIFLRGGGGPMGFGFEWLGDEDDPYKSVILKLSKLITDTTLPDYADNTRYVDAFQQLRLYWMNMVQGLFPDLNCFPMFKVALGHKGSMARSVPPPPTEAYKRFVMHHPLDSEGILPKSKKRLVRRSRLRGIQKRKYERWLQLGAKYHNKGPKKPHQHHTTRPVEPNRRKGSVTPLGSKTGRWPL